MHLIIKDVNNIVLGNYIIHIFNDEMHMGRNVRCVIHHLPLPTSPGRRETVCLSGSDYHHSQVEDEV